MLIRETATLNDMDFTHTYSNEGFKIRQEETGILYDEAYDVQTYTYTETDLPVDTVDEEADYAEAGRILLGEAE